MLSLIFLIAFIVLEIIAALSVPSGRINLVAAGLACLGLSMVVGHF